MSEAIYSSDGKGVVLKHKTKVLLIIFTILIIALLIGLWFFYPARIFERKFDFKLSDTAEVKKSSYSIFDDILYIKIEFEADDYSKILTDFNKFYEESKESWDTFVIPPSFCSSCPWWDMNEAYIVNQYFTFADGPWGRKTREIYTFVLHDPEGKYYLYCKN